MPSVHVGLMLGVVPAGVSKIDAGFCSPTAGASTIGIVVSTPWPPGFCGGGTSGLASVGSTGGV